MLSRILSYFAVLWLLAAGGCGAQKQISKAEGANPIPEWVKHKPIDAGYYYGVGKADKRYHGSDYQQAAKKAALEDLASEIEVNLDAQSVLYQNENSRAYYETYQSTVRIDVSQNLSGFEPVDSWGNANEYWVLYRLSKSKYRETETEKRNRAVDEALHYLNLAGNQMNVTKKLDNLFRAVESIKPYLNKPLKTTYENRTVYLGNYITAQIRNLLEGLRFKSGAGRIVLSAANCFSETRHWTLEYKGVPAGGFPVRVKYNTYTAKQLLTDGNGMVEYRLTAVFYEDTPPDVEVKIATADLIDDPLIRSLFETDYAAVRTTVSLKKPVFLIESEKGKNRIESAVLKAGGLLADDPENADIILHFGFRWDDLGKAGDFYTNKCTVTAAYDGKNVPLPGSRNWPPAKGVHVTREGARDKATSNALKQIDYRWFRKLINELCEQ